MPITFPRPLTRPVGVMDRLSRLVHGRLVQCDPLSAPPTTGWGWRCACGASDDGFAASHLAIEAAEYHARGCRAARTPAQ